MVGAVLVLLAIAAWVAIARSRAADRRRAAQANADRRQRHEDALRAKVARELDENWHW
jgi:hypothetical protein